MSVIISQDTNEEMVKIEKDGKVVFEGNYWDFSRTAPGIAYFLQKLGLEVEVKNYKYSSFAFND